VVSGTGPAVVKAQVVGWNAIDRVELLRGEKVLYTYCHSGNWDLPQGDGTVRLKMRVDFGWGPSSWHGFKTSHKIWEGQLRLEGARLLDVQGGFTCLGQRIESTSDRGCTFHLETKPRPKLVERASEVGWAGSMGWYRMQSLLFELEGSPADRVHLAVDGESVDFSLQEAMQGSRVLALMGEARALVKEQFGLSPDDIVNADLYWQNSYRVKVHVAIPESGYNVPFEFLDEAPPPGRTWYRLRISQLNGQMAWSSPIWLNTSQE